MPIMSKNWPDDLSKPTSQEVSELLIDFWTRLADLSEPIARSENLLCAEYSAGIRSILIHLVLALNGITRPDGTRNLNSYLSPHQRRALEKTLVAPAANRDSWIGQAVAMVVIYRWYAPQLVEKYQVPYPAAAERGTLGHLSDALADWPQSITTDY